MENTKLLFTVQEACRTLSIGRSKLYTLIADGQIETIHIGRRRLIKRESLMKLAGLGGGLND